MNKKYEIVYPSDLSELLKGVEWVSIDTETTGLEYPQSNPLYLSFSTSEDNGYLLKLEDFSPEITQLVSSLVSKKILFNAQFDDLMLRKKGYRLHQVEFDCQLAAYILNPSEWFTLKDLAKKELGENLTEFKDLFPGVRKIADRKIEKLDIQTVLNYACDDSRSTFRLRPILENKLKEDPNDWKLFKLEMRISEILTDMVETGNKINPQVLKKAEKICQKNIQEALDGIAGYLGPHLNPASPKQLNKALFEDLGLPIVGLTKGTNPQPSTDKECLVALKNDHPVIPYIQQFKEHSKLLSTYIQKIPTMLDENGILHGRYNQIGTVTGRFSSSEPNLQNMPVLTKTGRMIRESFISRFPKGRLIVADQSQFEVRLMAQLSQEPLMLAAFKTAKRTKTKIDYHQIKADELGLTGPDARHHGKTLNFAMLYNVGYEKLAQDIDQSEVFAQELLEKQDDTYVHITEWKDKQIDLARNQGYVQTILGRKLYIGKDKYEGTTGVNYPIQGSAADLLKLSMVMIYDHIKRMGFETKMVMQVHDELVFDCPNDEEERLLVPYIRQALERPCWEGEPIHLDCPLEADIKIVQNWGQAKG